MKVGDLVLHNGKEIGIIEHIWEHDPVLYDSLDDSVDVDVWFANGEFQVDSRNLEVINENH